MKNKVCQSLVTDRSTPLLTPVSSTNKNDRLHIPDILLKVALHTHTIKTSCLKYLTKNIILSILYFYNFIPELKMANHTEKMSNRKIGFYNVFVLALWTAVLWNIFLNKIISKGFL